MDSNELLKCVWIGRSLANRLESGGIVQDYRNKTNKVEYLKTRLRSMYGANLARKLPKNPSKRSVKRENTTTNCNAYLSDLKKNRSFARKFFVNMDDYKCSRLDQERHQNYYCLFCSSWTTGKWSNHRSKCHITLSPLEDLTVRLHSSRHKVGMLHILLTKFDVFPRNSSYGFEVRVKMLNYALESIRNFEEKYSKTAYTIFPRPYLRRHDRIPANPHNLVIKQGRFICEMYHPIDTRLHVFAFNRLRRLFGQKYKGFVDYVNDCPYKMNKSRKQKYERLNPFGHNCLNFLWIVSKSRDVGHLALGLYKVLSGEVWIYDSGQLRCYPDDAVDDRIADQLWLFHGHANPNVCAGYCKQYDVQSDEWSCGYHSLFAAICILAGEAPENYKIDVLATFKMTKKIVEERFKNLKSLKIRDVLDQIATKKSALPYQKPKMYYLDPRQNQPSSPVEQKKKSKQ